MLRRLGSALAMLAVFACAGGHWAVLQTVAWAGMIRTYAAEGTLLEAVEKTFDGDHPCAMCKRIAKGRTSERSTPANAELVRKIELAPPPAGASRLFARTPDYLLPLPELAVPDARFSEPPSPVPRSA